MKINKKIKAKKNAPAIAYLGKRLEEYPKPWLTFLIKSIENPKYELLSPYS